MLQTCNGKPSGVMPMPFAGMSHGDDDGASDDDLVAAEDAGTSLEGTHLSAPHKYGSQLTCKLTRTLLAGHVHARLQVLVV